MVRLMLPLVLLLPLALPALAQEATVIVQDGNPLRLAGAVATADAAPSTQGFIDAGRPLRQANAPPYTGNADADFMRAMIPQQQSAIAMARVEMEYGTDPEMRRLAGAIIAARQTELDRMTDWRAAHHE